jgi:transcriptional regulator with XRE-family HTH domain
LGAFFRALRERRGIGLRQAADLARRRRLSILNLNSLGALERGKTKNPQPALLRELATLYEMTYEELVAPLIDQQYGIDISATAPREAQLDQGGSRGSLPAYSVPALDVEAATTKVVESAAIAFNLGEQLQQLAADLLGRHVAALGLTPPERVEADRSTRAHARRSRKKKTR